MYKISIVIPVYKHWDLAGNLLRGLHRHEKDNIHEIILVDDCSNDIDVYNGVEVLSKVLPITYLENKENLGFTLSCNKGLEEATKTFAERKMVFLISTDVDVYGKFIESCAEVLSEPRKHFLGHRHIYHDTGWNTFDGRTYDYLEGYFLACTAEGWKDLGFFDPKYAPYDYEDIDISVKAKKQGYKLVQMHTPMIKHLGGGSIGYNKDREAITLRNKEYFKQKWVK